jgi:putative flippase GtrA
VRAREFLAFGLVGVAAALFHYGTLVALVELAAIGAVPASAAGFVAGGLVSYWLNYHWTFQSSRRHQTALPSFFLIALVGLGLNTLLMAALTGGLGLQYLLAQVLTTSVLLFWHWLANRRWTFS